MKPVFFSLVALSLLALGSCRKDHTTTAEGWVGDPTATSSSGGVVAGARVYLLQTHGTSIYAAPTRVQHTTADASGRYSLSFEADGNDRYALQATAPGYFDTPETETTSLETGRKNKKNVLLRPEAWLRIQFVSSASTNTLFTSLFTPTISGLYDIPSPADSTVVVRCAGNVENQIIWTVKGPASPGTQYEGKSYCPAHDTTDYIIRF